MDTTNCWGFGIKDDEPCWGEMHCSEDHPGIYSFWCDGHDHPEDYTEYRKQDDLESRRNGQNK